MCRKAPSMAEGHSTATFILRNGAGSLEDTRGRRGPCPCQRQATICSLCRGPERQMPGDGLLTAPLSRSPQHAPLRPRRQVGPTLSSTSVSARLRMEPTQPFFSPTKEPDLRNPPGGIAQGTQEAWGPASHGVSGASLSGFPGLEGGREVQDG